MALINHPATIKKFILILFITGLLCVLLKHVHVEYGTDYVEDSAGSDEEEDDQIFFWETSGRNSIDFRQSCAVESAARQNGDRPVVLYMTSKTVNYSSPSLRLLDDYSNIRIETIDLTDYFKGSLLEGWYKEGKWKKSPYRLAHLSDYLRILTAYRYGGQYFDLDVVVLKSLNGMRNYVVEEGPSAYWNGAFHFEKEHPIIRELMEKMAIKYDPNSWAGQGPHLLTKVVLYNCIVNNGMASGPKCGSGIKVFPQSAFIPFGYEKLGMYFQNNTSYEAPEVIKQAYAIHLFSHVSRRYPVIVGSSQYYAILSAKYCPLTFASALNVF